MVSNKPRLIACLAITILTISCFRTQPRRQLDGNLQMKIPISQKTISNNSRKILPPSPHPRYHELSSLHEISNHSFQSVYSQGKVVNTSQNWFHQRKLCRETCCVETHAIPLNRDGRRIINWMDPRELSDLRLEIGPGRRNTTGYKFHSSELHEDMLPCLVPGTIIYLHNHISTKKRFFMELRPKITVPFAVILAGTDANSPGFKFQEFLMDPLLIKMYSTNPQENFKTELQNYTHKFQSLPIGLADHLAQSTHINPYLKLTNYSNPFGNPLKTKYRVSSSDSFDFDQQVFVHFNYQNRGALRPRLWQMLCTNMTHSPNSDGISCGNQTQKLPIHRLYKSMSHYRFGISPPGLGYDCYRTYELLLLGVIPIVQQRSPNGDNLFKGLPVIHMDMRKATTKQDFVDAIYNFTSSDAFLNTDFEAGWNRLFLRYSRWQLLQDTGRAKDLLVGPSPDSDREEFQYYKGFHYTISESNNESSSTRHSQLKSQTKPGNVDAQWVRNNALKPSPEDERWVSDWEQAAATTM